MTVYCPITGEVEQTLCFARTALKQLADATNDESYARHAVVLSDLIATVRMLEPAPEVLSAKAWAAQMGIDLRGLAAESSGGTTGRADAPTAGEARALAGEARLPSSTTGAAASHPSPAERPRPIIPAAARKGEVL